jgi:ferritin-like metal-binding protein YciE
MKQSTTRSTRSKKTGNTSSQKRSGAQAQSNGRTGAAKAQTNERGQDQGSGMRGNRQDGPSRRTGRQEQQAGEKMQNGQGNTYLEKFFLNQLKDIYYAEQKITQSLPKMIQATTTEELREAFEDHLHLTERHVRRLEKVFECLGQKPQGEKCEAIEGITREVETIIGETTEGTMTRDAALILGAQKVEHYEIATYGGLVQLAITMGLYEAADLLDKTLIEEEMTDSMLTDIAENYINIFAEEEGSHEWQESPVEQGPEGQQENMQAMAENVETGTEE